MSAFRWTFSFAIEVFRNSWTLVIVSLSLSAVTSVAIISLGNKISLESLQFWESLSIGVVVVLASKFALGLIQDVLSCYLSRKAQLHLVKRYVLSQRSKFSPSEDLHRITFNGQMIVSCLFVGLLNLSSALIMGSLLLTYFFYEHSSHTFALLLFFLIGLVASLGLQVILRKLSVPLQRIEGRLFEDQKNLVFGRDTLEVSGEYGKWEAKFIDLLERARKFDLLLKFFHHGSNNLSWGMKFVFVVLIITPIAATSGIPTEIAYWLYILLGVFTQFFWGLIQVGELRSHVTRVRDLVGEEREKDKRFHHPQRVIKATDLRMSFGAKEIGCVPLNFTWRSGEKIWVMGESGSGKTTLLRSICGLHQGYSGELGVHDGWRISYVPQSPYFFEGKTIAENLNHFEETQRLRNNVKGLRLESLFQDIGWDLNLKIGVGGFNVSKGQLTRLAILRELLRDSDMYLFDEPTSSLDKETGFAVISHIQMCLSEKLVAVVEHKSHIEMGFVADQCLYLGNIMRASEIQSRAKQNPSYRL